MIQPAEIKSVCRYGSNNNSKKILPVYIRAYFYFIRFTYIILTSARRCVMNILGNLCDGCCTSKSTVPVPQLVP